MKISALRLFNVRRFVNRGVAIEGIGDGVNVLTAANEFGKSTSFEALHALFFLPYSSKSKDVQGLRPYAGGSPIVQADIVTEAGAYQVTKSYFGSASAQVLDLRTGHLVAQADDAENFISTLIRGGDGALAGGPAGLLWVRQGITGLDNQSKPDKDKEQQARSSLLESVQGEVEAVTGGRRMADVLARTQEALLRLVTPTGRPKAGADYAKAVERHEQAIKDADKLKLDLDDLRVKLDDLKAVRRQLAALEDPDAKAERQSELDIARKQMAAAQLQSERRAKVEAEQKLAQQNYDIAKRKNLEFKDAETSLRLISAELAQSSALRDELKAQRSSVQTEIDELKQKLDALEQQALGHRKMSERLERAREAREAADQLQALEAQYAKAEDARRQIELASAELSRLALPEADVEQLQKLENQITIEEARAQAAQPSVIMRYEAAQSARIVMDDKALEDGEERTYGHRSSLQVPGLGQLELRASHADKDAASLDGLREARRKLLTSLGVEGLAAARARQSQARHKQDELTGLRAQLTVHAPNGLPDLLKQIETRRAMVGEHLELKEDPRQVHSALQAIEDERTRLKPVLVQRDAADRAAEARLTALIVKVSGLETECRQLEAILGPKADREEAGRRLVHDAERLESVLAEATERAELLQADSVDLSAVEARLSRVEAVVREAEQQVSRLRETIAGLEGSIKAWSDEAVEEKWREAVERRDAAGVRLHAFEREVAVLTRLRDALEDARTQARDHYLQPVMAELAPLLNLLFDDAKIVFDDSTLLPRTLIRNGQEEDVDRLSGGMREQLSILTRLAFARLLSRDGRPVPVILDDALVYSDDDRIEKMFDALHHQAQDQQIIVFSCRQRAFQKLGGKALEMVEWGGLQPA
jgi:DNA repair exonuclease SbcCD ATPase subunit